MIGVSHILTTYFKTAWCTLSRILVDLENLSSRVYGLFSAKWCSIWDSWVIKVHMSFIGILSSFAYEFFLVHMVTVQKSLKYLTCRLHVFNNMCKIWLCHIVFLMIFTAKIYSGCSTYSWYKDFNLVTEVDVLYLCKNLIVQCILNWGMCYS
jgi:hypothetical protein